MQTNVEEFDVTARQLETDSSIARKHAGGLLEGSKAARRARIIGAAA